MTLCTPPFTEGFVTNEEDIFHQRDLLLPLPLCRPLPAVFLGVPSPSESSLLIIPDSRSDCTVLCFTEPSVVGLSKGPVTLTECILHVAAFQGTFTHTPLSPSPQSSPQADPCFTTKEAVAHRNKWLVQDHMAGKWGTEFFVFTVWCVCVTSSQNSSQKRVLFKHAVGYLKIKYVIAVLEIEFGDQQFRNSGTTYLWPSGLSPSVSQLLTAWRWFLGSGSAERVGFWPARAWSSQWWQRVGRWRERIEVQGPLRLHLWWGLWSKVVFREGDQ